MLILSGSTALYVLLLRGSGTPRYRPSSGCPSGGSSSTTISTLLIAARRSAGRELSASSIASSNGSLRPGPERASISAMLPESVLGQRRLLLGGFVASVAALTALAALPPGDAVVVDDVLAPPSSRTIIDELDFPYWWPTEIGWRRASGALKPGVRLGRPSASP